MHGGLALAPGLLHVGLSAKTAEVRVFDLEGRLLRAPVRFKDERTGRSAIGGLALDGDRRLWVVDAAAGRLRTFSAFGRAAGSLELGVPAEERAPVLLGRVWRPVDVEVQGTSEAGWLALAGAGEQRHAVQLFTLEGEFLAALRSHGDGAREFRGVTALAARGDELFVVEGAGRTVQVFRAREFHYAFRLAARGGEVHEPCALAPLADGRLLVLCRAPGEALFLLEPSGRVLACLATAEGEHALVEAVDVAFDELERRVYVLDLAGLRVQVFTLEGQALGSFATNARVPREKKGGR